MTWKVINISDAGTGSKFGSDDLDKVNKGFSGTDVDDYDINSDFVFRSGKLNIRNPANTFNYNIVGGAITTSNKTLNLPLLTGTDTFVVTGLAQTLSNKTLDATCTVAGAVGGFDPTVQTTTWRRTTAGAQGFEIGSNNASGGTCYIDMHRDSTDGDYSARIERGITANDDLDITNTGTGNIDLNSIFKVGPNSASGSGVNIVLPDVSTATTLTKNFKLRQNITATGATADDYYPMDVEFTYLATNPTSAADLASAGLHVTTVYGSGAIDAKGTIQTLTSTYKVLGCNSDSEMACLMGYGQNVAEKGSMWWLDANLHGPTIQPSLFTGLNMFMNNHYNGSPLLNTSNGIGIYTQYGTGGGSAVSQDTSTTYPIDLGLIICGTSGSAGAGTTNGFTTGIQVGGTGGSWTMTGSRIGTGMKIFDCFTNCIDTSSQTAANVSYILKLPNDGKIGRSTTGNISWDSSDNLTVNTNLMTTKRATGVGSSVSVFHPEAGFRPDIVKYGSYACTGNATGDGLLNGRMAGITVGAGPPTNSGGWDTTAGSHRLFDTSATINNIAGMRMDSAILARILNGFFKARITTGSSIANTRIFCGLVADAAAPASAADPLNAKSGVALWYDSAVNANWRRYHNDSSGAGVSDDTTLAVATSTQYTVEIEAITDTKFTFKFNGTDTDISTDIPGSTTGLAWWIYIENTTAASRTMKLQYVVCRSDK